MATPDEILKQYWGFDRLWPAQKKAITYILEGKDVITLLPTGGGKSVCFQVPAIMQEGICLVVSPLISLMQDQVSGLKKRGVKAMMLSGAIPFQKLNAKLDNCLYGGYKFLYLSPERLQHELVQQRLQQMNINLVAIDEAHCISEWGHDFRPAYREITLLKELLPEVNFIALTATATPRVLEDIKENLELEKSEVVRTSFARDNIALCIKKNENKTYELQKFLQRHPGVSIVYVRSRQLTLRLSKFLNSHQLQANAYHGGMNPTQKEKLFKDWQAEKFKIMVATNAFGMGIDKANVRNVIHYHLPDSLEAYYQEVGRAGRDGKASKAFLIYDNADILKLKKQFIANSPTPKSVKTIYRKLNSYFSIAYGEGQNTSHNFNFLDFCNTYGFNTYLAYNVFQFLDRLAILSLTKEFHQRTELFFKISHRELYRFINTHKKFKLLIDTLLRMQGGFFEYKTTINLRELQNRTGLNRGSINHLLSQLDKLEVIDLTLADQDSTIEFLVPREDNHTINPLIPYIKQYLQNKKHQITEVINFVHDDQICKMRQLLRYFGEERNQDCGQCAVCQKPHRRSKGNSKTHQELRRAISDALQQGELNSKTLVSQLDYNEKNVLFVLKQMLDNGELKLQSGDRYSLS